MLAGALVVPLTCGAVAARPGIARADDREAATAILSTLAPTSIDDAVKQAKDALERGTRMRVAGDLEHSRIAEGLALEWAELARDRARAEAMEKDARHSELAAIDAAARVEREQALLEESITRSGRLRAELAALTTKDARAKAKDRTSSLPVDAPAKPGSKPASPTGKEPKTRPVKGPGTHVDADAPATEPDHGGAR
jgi:hypothetical protein